jgi:putative ABC transport system permease protein
VADTRQDSPASPLKPTLYMPLLQHPFHANEVHVVMRTTRAPASLVETVRRRMQSLSPETATKFTTLDAMVANSVATPRLRTTLAGLFAGVALLLAMAGMYGVMTYVAMERVPEFAVRMAFGASSRNVLALILGRAAQMAALGVVGGVALALSATRVIEAMLFGVTATDAIVYAAVLLVAIPLIVLAAAIPAWRATRLEPVTILRNA